MQIEQRDNTLTYKSSCTWFDDGQILIETATHSIWYGGLANFEGKCQSLEGESLTACVDYSYTLMFTDISQIWINKCA